MCGAIPPLPQYAFMACCSVKKHRDNFTFTLLSHLMEPEREYAIPKNLTAHQTGGKRMGNREGKTEAKTHPRENPWLSQGSQAGRKYDKL
jgi:hypothetical protein